MISHLEDLSRWDCPYNNEADYTECPECMLKKEHVKGRKLPKVLGGAIITSCDSCFSDIKKDKSEANLSCSLTPIKTPMKITTKPVKLTVHFPTGKPRLS